MLINQIFSDRISFNAEERQHLRLLGGFDLVLGLTGQHPRCRVIVNLHLVDVTVEVSGVHMRRFSV